MISERLFNRLRKEFQKNNNVNWDYENMSDHLSGGASHLAEAAEMLELDPSIAYTDGGETLIRRKGNAFLRKLKSKISHPEIRARDWNEWMCLVSAGDSASYTYEDFKKGEAVPSGWGR